MLKSNNEDVPEQRYASNVYKSVYAVAHSLHNLLKCKEKEGCETDLKIQPQQVIKSHTHTHTHTNTDTCLFFVNCGTLHRRNGFYTVQTVYSIALQQPYINLPLT